MRNIIRIFLRDCKRIGRNWVAVVVMIGVCFLPALYAWFNIAANIDPYANTQDIQIAVASNDKGAMTDIMGELNVGDMIIENLKENDQLGWNFMTEEEAIEGVRAGTYYAAIVIPEDFTESMVSVLSGNIVQPKIDYYLNEKKNAIAPKVTDTGASTIQSQINSTFVSIASETVADLINEAGGDISSKVDNAEASASESLAGVLSALTEFSSKWEEFDETYQNAMVLIDNSKTTLQNLKQTSTDAASVLDNTDALVTDAQNQYGALSSDIANQFSDARSTMLDLTAKVNEKLAPVNESIQQVTGDITSLNSAAIRITQLNGSILESLNTFNSTYPGYLDSSLLEELTAANARHQAVASGISSSADAIASMSSILSELTGGLSDSLIDGNTSLSSIEAQINGQILPSLRSSVDNLHAAGGTLEGILVSAAADTDQLIALLDSTKATLTEIHDSLGSVADVINTTADTLRKTQEDFELLTGSQDYLDLLTLNGLDTDAIADFMSSPIELTTIALYPVENYGSGMTPFYTNLALWVSGVILVSLLKMEVDKDEKLKEFRAIEAYLGRGILFVVTGLIMSVIICVGDIWLIGVQCVHPVAFIFAGVVTSFVYVNLIYALTSAFKHIGKAIAVLLVILQIPGSSGTYPIEMTPDFFQFLHPLLPFTYSINAMRECIAGMYGNLYAKNLAYLLVFLLIALIIGLGIGPLLLNLNRFLDIKLGESGLVISEEKGGAVSRIRLENAIRVATSSPEARQMMKEGVEHFEKHYHRRTVIGLLLILILPLIFLVLMFSIDSKMIFLSLWIGSVIAIAVYLIIHEYIHQNLHDRGLVLEFSEEELRSAIRNDGDTAYDTLTEEAAAQEEPEDSPAGESVTAPPSEEPQQTQDEQPLSEQLTAEPDDNSGKEEQE